MNRPSILGPYALLDAGSRQRPELAVVLIGRNNARHELLLTVDVASRGVAAELHAGDLEATGRGDIEIRDAGGDRCTVVGNITLGGIDTTHDLLESIELSIAVSWRRESRLADRPLHVAGAAIGYRATARETTTFEAVRSHPFNRFETPDPDATSPTALTAPPSAA